MDNCLLLIIFGVALLAFGVCGAISDYILPRIGWLNRWLDEEFDIDERS